MADANRINPDYFVLHHAVTPTWENKSKQELAQWFSDNGFARGYSSNPANWSGLINPYTGGRSYSMAHLAGQRVDSTTPDATDQERADGYRIVQLIDDIWGQITWNAGNWPINQRAIGIENVGDYRNYPLRDGDIKVLAAWWKIRDDQLGGNSFVVGHEEVSQLGTECPAQIMNARDQIVAYINNPPVAPVVVPPAPTPVTSQFVYERLPAPVTFKTNKQPTNAYDLDGTTWEELSNSVVTTLAQGTDFVAVGKTFHPLGGMYYMTQYSFGNADTTGVPDHNRGVNAVDLDGPTIDTVAPAPVETPTLPEEDDGSVKIPVTVNPVDPNKYQTTFESDVNYLVAIKDTTVVDFGGTQPDLPLKTGMKLTSAGTFEKDGVEYYRTQKSATNGWWYGVPKEDVAEDESIFEIAQKALTGKEKFLKWVASIVNWFTRKK